MTGGRLNRFNVVKQSKDYDQHGEYVKLWLPELKNVPNEFVHEPWKMTAFQQIQYNVRLGVDYPHPIAPPYRHHTGNNNENQSKQRRPHQQSDRNRHQKFEMKSVKTGDYRIG